LELAYKGPAHEPGNIFIYAPDQKVLMLVDVVFPGWTPFRDLAEAENTPAYMRAHDQILEYDFDTFIGGHVGRLGTRSDVETQREYMIDMATNAATALQTVDFNAVAGELMTNNLWLMFDTYLDQVAQMCTEKPP
jgi:glyoxylase-like metal-dependent hydrolase (beta-lactamase superfamily II)